MEVSQLPETELCPNSKYQAYPRKGLKSGGSFKLEGFSNHRPFVLITADQYGVRIPNYLRCLHLVSKTEEKRDPTDERSAGARESKRIGE